MSSRWFSVPWVLSMCATFACQSRDASVGEAVAAQSAAATSAPVIRQDIEGLGQLVTLPFRPASVTWQERQLNNNRPGGVPAPTDYLVVAVLRYEPADAERVAAAAAQRGSAASETEYSNWFPSDLAPLAKPNEDGKQVLRGPGYHAADYYRSPYRAGELVRVASTGYFVLRLITR